MGLNNFYNPGMQLLVNDFDKNGAAEHIVCEEMNNQLYPIHDLDEMFSQLPGLKKKFTFYNDFAKASISDFFDREVIDEALSLKLDELQSVVLINDGNQTDFTMDIMGSSLPEIFAVRCIKGQQKGAISKTTLSTPLRVPQAAVVL